MEITAQQPTIDFENLAAAGVSIEKATIPEMLSLLSYGDYKFVPKDAVTMEHAERFIRGWKKLSHANHGIFSSNLWLNHLTMDESAEYVERFGLAPEQQLARTILANTVSVPAYYSYRDKAWLGEEERQIIRRSNPEYINSAATFAIEKNTHREQDTYSLRGRIYVGTVSDISSRVAAAGVVS